MNTPIQTQHNGIEITYNEKTNLWIFEVRGRECKVESLDKARGIIDTPDPKVKPPFTRLKAYTERSYQGSGFQTVEVTSIAHSHDWHTTEYWTSNSKGNRQKLSYHTLFPVNEKNDALISKIKMLDDQREALSKEREALVRQLSPMSVEK